ncbi:MAG: choice-of-anchor D domain-containing protein [Nitrospirae bacterium]|nr:choice-of-anchor D domain-containing protein [Nitrospirota bacterium]
MMTLRGMPIIMMSRSFDNIMGASPSDKAGVAVNMKRHAISSGINRRLSLFVIALLFSVFIVPFAHASEKTVWNAYQSPLFSGSYNYNHSIVVPPGIDGLSPKVSISYKSYLAKNRAGWVGAGWEVPSIYIQRNIQNTITDTNDDTFELIFGGAKSEFVFVQADGRYHTKIESYLKIEKKIGATNEKGDYWIVTAKDGTEYRFGYNLDSENKVNSSDLTVQYIWRWSLDRIKDTNGNCVYFTYTENPTANDKGAVYLSRIEYNNDKKRMIDFILENTDRPDIYQTVDQGSEIQEARRLSEIRIIVDGSTVKKFRLEYSYNAVQNKSFLTSITKYGSDGTTALPPTRFEYTTYTDSVSGEQADLLSKITSELGGITTVAYTGSSAVPNTTLPYNYWLVSSLTLDNGMTGAHASTSTLNLSYENGAYDLISNEFRGFGKVTETRADGTKITHSFHQDNAKKGREYQTLVTDAQDKPYLSTDSVWTDSLSNDVYIVRLQSTEEKTFDGVPDNPKIVKTEFQNFDEYGNVGLAIDHGDLSISGDETYSYSEFVYNTDRWIVNKTKHSYVSTAPCASSTSCTSKLRGSWFYYDGWFINDGVPFKGNLTKEEHWNNKGSNPVIQHQYDSFGNLVQTIDPAGRSTKINYETVFNTFPIEVINAKNQLERRKFNAYGQMTEQTDPNGNTTTYAYDVLNRLFKVVKPYDSDAYPTLTVQYGINAAPPHRIVSSARETADGGTLDSVKIVDGFGRALQARSEYENPANSIVSDVFYDSMGRDYRHSNSYLTAYSLDYTTPDISKPKSQTDYDAIGRPHKITNPDSTFSTYSFDHWSATETDENNNSKTQAFDSNGKLIQVIERNSGQSYTTNYQYNPVGELLQLTDHYGNTSVNEYDSLGRKTRMVDADLGERRFEYDLTGSMTSQTDAKGIATRYMYDPLNRMTLIDYPNDQDVYFVFDLNTKGAVSQITDSVGTVSFKYDQRIRKTEETRTADGFIWTTKWEYDSMDRVVKQTYPDGGIVNFNYTGQGELGSIPGIINSMSYNASGLLIQKIYANGKSTTFTYNDTNQRLTGISSAGIQNFTYTYDPVGNLKSITDSVGARTESFEYDALNRLTHAFDNAATNSYDTNYVYDAIGNMLSEKNNKTGEMTQYTYGQGTAKPHAVTGKAQSLPVIGSFVLNNGNAYSTHQQITLNNISFGNSTDYMASEDQNFIGASWQAFSTAPNFMLSPGFVKKTVYFKVRNANGESQVKSDDIEFMQDTDNDETPDSYDSDDDNDGIPDIADTSPLDSTNAALDPDNDGLNNLQEYLNNTNPNNPDSDNDGWSDNYEIMTSGTNPNSADTDGDGVNDPVDTNPRNPYNDGFSENYSVRRWTFNAGGAASRSSEAYMVNIDRLGSGFSKGAFVDTDGDGLPDTWENINGLNPVDATDAQSDTDGDGLTNLQEFLNNTNPLLSDSDNDGWSDYIEIYIKHTDPNDPDTDNDGVNDSRDPDSKSIYHFGVSENYSIRNGTGLSSGFNEGGGVRSSETFTIADIIGGNVNGALSSSPTLTVEPDTVNFDNAVVGNPSSVSLFIQNEGVDNIVIGTITIAGKDTIEFTLQNDNCSNRILSPFITCTVQVVLIPKSNGAKGAVVNIPYNDSEIKYKTVSMAGIVIPDAAPPDTIITGKPANPSNESWATFNFTSTELNSTFECKIDGNNFTACTNPTGYVYLADGDHVFSVRATDAAGNTDPSPAVYTWTIDTVRPASIITSPQNGTTVIGSAFTIKGTASDIGTGVQKIEISTDGGATWNIAIGTTSWSYAWTISADGIYTIKSRATDKAGNVEILGSGITVTAYNRQPSAVSINGRQMLLNSSPFTVKGVVYSPVPIGHDPETTPPYGDYFTSDQFGIYDRDLPLLRAMGVNTVRLYNWNNTANHLDFLDKAYNGGVKPIYVIAGFWINGGQDIDPASSVNVREQLKAQFREMVSIHKNHPAILMWAIGSDLNANSMYGGSLNNLFSLINELSAEAHAEDGNHPVTMPLADINIINTITAYNSSVPNLDVWGANVYRGNSFGTLFNDYNAASSKPLIVLEYGIDAYNKVTQTENESTQANYANSLWTEIKANSSVCIGGTITAYSDEWWRAKYSTDNMCTDTDPSVHSACGFADSSQPDGYSNEEWWGVMKVSLGNSPDIMSPRQVYYTLQGVWLDTDGDGVPDASDNCKNASNPDQADADGDGVGNVCDNCRLVANPDQYDSNSLEDDNTSKPGIQHYGNKCDPDFNNDGVVSITDFNEWKKYKGQPVPPAPAGIDLNGDNFIWIQDYNIWRSYYGKPPGPGVGD